MASYMSRAADTATLSQLLSFILGSSIIALALRSIYRLYLHPLAKYPGPRLAAVSDAWFAYRLLEGCWPWTVEQVVEKYGDIVRIGPNEMVFATPQALADLYGSHNRNIEVFAKTQINNHGNDEHGGIIFEWDPVRHRRVSKQLSPAFSSRALRAKEPTLHRYIDLFIRRMEQYGGGDAGVDLSTWISWLCVDVSADMAYNREMNSLQSMKEPPYLSLLNALNKAIVVIQMSWRFPLLSPLRYIYFLTAARGHSMTNVKAHSRFQLEQRIRRKNGIEHLDFFEQIIPEGHEPPKDPKEMRHLEQVAGQLLLAGYEPPAMWLFAVICHLSNHTDALATLVEEVRSNFGSYEEITAASAAALPYLTACLKETLRLVPGVISGMPVVSPGALVDGAYIPKGVVCQSSMFALARSRHNFREPLSYRPQRWLPPAHDLHDACFDDDKKQAFQPFSQGPRMCSGREVAWWQSRVFLAKVLWTFDLQVAGSRSVDLDRDMRAWSMFKRPDVRIRFENRDFKRSAE